MSRFLFLLSTLLVSLALAAPTPKPKDYPFRSSPWEKAIDPDKDCKFTYGRDSVTIEVPDKPHGFNSKAYAKSNAPRLLRKIEGDFVMEVRVTGPFKATGAPVDKRGLYSPLVAAGLILVIDGRPPGGIAPKAGFLLPKMSSLRMEFGSHLGQDGQEEFDAIDTEGISAHHSSTDKGWLFPKGAKSAYLKMTHKKEELHCEASPDRKEWTWFSKPGIGLRKEVKVKVGLFARSTSKDKFKVTFDQFKLTQLKAKPAPAKP